LGTSEDVSGFPKKVENRYKTVEDEWRMLNFTLRFSKYSEYK
jgi:hypothetical protein